MTIDPRPSSAQTAGLRQLLDPPKLTLDKAPVLQSIFDHSASSYSDAMREFSTARCACTLNGITCGSTSILLAQYASGVGALFHSADWDAHIVIGYDHGLAISIIEAMYGADGSEPPTDGNRPLTALEQSIVQRILARKAEILQEEFKPVYRTQLLFERLEAALDFPRMRLNDAPALMAQFNFEVFERRGRMFILMPVNALTPFRDRLERDSPSETAHVDPSWSRQLRFEIGRAQVELIAVLEGSQLSLDALSRLRPGQILTLDASPNTPIQLEIEDKAIFTAKLGQSKGLFTVCVERTVDQCESLLADLVRDQIDV